MPTRKTEHWKYTSLRSLQPDYAVPSDGTIVLAEAGIELPRFDGFRLVFINGHFSAEHSDAECARRCFDGALSPTLTPLRPRKIRDHLGVAVGREQPLFTALNDAALAEGVFLDIEPRACIEQPVHVIWVSGNQGEAFSINQRLLVLCGRIQQCLSN